MYLLARFQLCYVVSKDATTQQVKLEALDIAGSVPDASITSDASIISDAARPVAKKVQGLAGILKKVIQDEASVSSELSVLNDM